jgi:single-strand DNA-binding protein
MANVNKVILIGNLTRDPQTKQLPNQNAVTEFGLATNRKFKGPDGEDREDVCFLDCAAFGRQAEVIQKYCRKGKLIYLEGRLRFDSWDDKNGHGKRSKLSIVVESFQFLGSREEGQEEGRSNNYRNERNTPRGNWDGANLPERPARSAPQQPFGEKLAFKEADIPF